MKSKYSIGETVFKTLADANRLKILEMLAQNEMHGDSILAQLDISQPTLSHHMKILTEAGLVEVRRDGRRTYYSVSNDGRDLAFDLLGEFIIPKEEQKQFVEKKKTRRSDSIVIL